ncbi:2-amino-4-hydroxy-6-hydroxymethyldihydropteridine diphosphokinase [Kocuria rhizophila]|uniref:2-amino-4-hydroxy-6- hydroxymethyldihydropteridine diphosphokinase n=1 Tax=Kocuria rhizophila TaxID=72000 RepID=UPI00174AE3AB|nr:2-amino-4-hydroxy-6-hydroxymethyldihydropteridine diphosphokinase [Kocuria rhizophila]MCR4526919.1 2-amino-4-hydroxy-6-hydroxymethyldihydropteridine diphosphokinase [Kocuria rhizophila]
MPLRCVVALGANLGDRITALREAVRELAATPGIALLATSPVVRTRSVGGPEGSPDYLNAVVELSSDLTPFELLEVCQGIEHRHGRTREVRWGPRTLDLDVICVAGARSTDPRLELPHPRAAQRAFVLRPWALMDPAAELDGVPVARLADAAPDREDLVVTEHTLRPEEPPCAT